MTQMQIKSLLGKANALVEKSSTVFGKVLIPKDEMVEIIEAIAKSLPNDLHEAELILARKEEIIQEAQNRAERIIQDGINEQARIVSEHEILRRVQEAATKQKQQVEEYCENIQSQAAHNAEEIKLMSIKEASRIQLGSEDYAEKIFIELAANVNQILENIRMCQHALAEQRARNIQTNPELYADRIKENESEE